MAVLSSLGLAAVLVLGSASIAAAQPTKTLKIPASERLMSASACSPSCSVTVTWTHAGAVNANNLVVVECNSNVFLMDPNACNENPSNIDGPGGPWLPADQSANGSTTFPLASGNTGCVLDAMATAPCIAPGEPNPAGSPVNGTVDGTCNLGQFCSLVLANISTMEPIVGPTAGSTVDWVAP